MPSAAAVIILSVANINRAAPLSAPLLLFSAAPIVPRSNPLTLSLFFPPAIPAHPLQPPPLPLFAAAARFSMLLSIPLCSFPRPPVRSDPLCWRRIAARWRRICPRPPLIRAAALFCSISCLFSAPPPVLLYLFLSCCLSACIVVFFGTPPADFLPAIFYVPPPAVFVPRPCKS